MMRKPSFTSGFSLLELSIVLIIIAMVTSALLSIGTQTTAASRKEITEQRMRVIAKAIGTWAARYKAIPCPAPGNIGQGNNAYGRGVNVANAATCAGTTTAANIFVGTVPIVTLELSDEYMLDGWNRRFTYVVDNSFVKMRDNTAITLASRGALEDTDADSTNMDALANIQVLNGSGQNAAAVLISHGSDGHGAWTMNGGGPVNLGATSPNVTAAEWENAGSGTTLTHNATFNNASEANNYDDLLMAFTRNDIIALAGGIIDQPTCEMLLYANLPLDETTPVPQGPIACTSEPGVTAPDFNCVNRQYSMSRPLLNLCFIFTPPS